MGYPTTGKNLKDEKLFTKAAPYYGAQIQRKRTQPGERLSKGSKKNSIN